MNELYILLLKSLIHHLNVYENNNKAGMEKWSCVLNSIISSFGFVCPGCNPLHPLQLTMTISLPSANSLVSASLTVFGQLLVAYIKAPFHFRCPLAILLLCFNYSEIHVATFYHCYFLHFFNLSSRESCR